MFLNTNLYDLHTRVCEKSCLTVLLAKYRPEVQAVMPRRHREPPLKAPQKAATPYTNIFDPQPIILNGFCCFKARQISGWRSLTAPIPQAAGSPAKRTAQSSKRNQSSVCTYAYFRAQTQRWSLASSNTCTFLPGPKIPLKGESIRREV